MTTTSISENAAPETAALPYSLAGQKVLVAGGGHHMGLAVVRAAAAAGARLVVIGRHGARSEHAAELATADGAAEAVSEQCDVSDADAVEALLERHAGFDHLAITISTGGSVTTIDATPVQAAREPFDNRFWPTYGLLHAASRHMAPNGSIVFTSGSSGRRPQVGLGSTAPFTPRSTCSRSPRRSSWHRCGSTQSRPEGSGSAAPVSWSPIPAKRATSAPWPWP
jgi:NAD(P)-dependent dehydrogenase (short-subunit alcohol dehydrogenase family)